MPATVLSRIFWLVLKIYRTLILLVPYTGVKLGYSYEGKKISCGIREQGVEEDIWAQMWGNRRLEKIT